MRKDILGFISIGMLMMVILTGCGKKKEIVSLPVVSVPQTSETKETEAENESEVIPAEEENTSPDMTYPANEQNSIDQLYPSDEIDIENLIIEKIGNNHTLDFILRQNKTAEEWSTTIDRMIGYGAKISPEEKQIIIDWLTSRK